MTERIDDLSGLGFDEVLERLRAVVARLEQGNLTLEQSLAAYEQGVGLARRGHELLDNVEKRVELLVRGNGGDETVPLAVGSESAGEPVGDASRQDAEDRGRR